MTREAKRAFMKELIEEGPKGVNDQTLSSRKEGDWWTCSKEERRLVSSWIFGSKRFWRKLNIVITFSIFSLQILLQLHNVIMADDRKYVAMTFLLLTATQYLFGLLCHVVYSFEESGITILWAPLKRSAIWKSVWLYSLKICLRW